MKPEDRDKLKKSLNLSDKDFKDAEDFENEVLGKPGKDKPEKIEPEEVEKNWSDENGNFFANIGDSIFEAEDEYCTECDYVLEFCECVKFGTSALPSTMDSSGQISMFNNDYHGERLGTAVVDYTDENIMVVATAELLPVGSNYPAYVKRDRYGRIKSIEIHINYD